MKNNRPQKTIEESNIKPSNMFQNIVKASSLVSGMIATLLVVCWLFFMLMPMGSWLNIVVGNSMVPTLHSGQIIFSDFGEVKRGDIVTLTLSDLGYDSAKKTLVKRVIGVPGDKIVITPTDVYVNDKLLVENYLTDEAKAQTFVKNQLNCVILGDDEYFVMGDNRGASTDSRRLGAIKADAICYKQSETPTFRFWLDIVIVVILFGVGCFTCTLVETGVTKLSYCLWRKINKTSVCSANKQENENDVEDSKGENE